MRTIYFIISLLLACSSAMKAQPQKITIETKKDYQLKGDVKQVVTSFENYTKKIVSKVLEFTPEGYLQYEGWLDSPQEGITYTYDKAGRLTKRKLVVKDNDFSIKTYTYNTLGLLTKYTLDTGEREPSYETYQYDAYGNIRQMGVQGIPSYIYRNIYDARKRLIKAEKLIYSSKRLVGTTEIAYLPNGWSKYVETTNLYKSLSEYDNKGRVRSDKRCDLQSGDVSFFIAKSYDDNDNLIEYQVSDKKICYIYNALGELTSKGYTGLDKNNSDTDESYTYTKHDAIGNWIERMIAYPKTNEKGRKETRTITYYPNADVKTTTNDPVEAFFKGSNFIGPQNGEFRANAPGTVAVGDQFRVNYTMEAENIRSFKAPSFSRFEVLMGPSKSTSKSTTKINGSLVTKSFITYTYILQAQKEGNFTVSGAIAESKGKTYTSNSVTIKVTPN